MLFHRAAGPSNEPDRATYESMVADLIAQGLLTPDSPAPGSFLIGGQTLNDAEAIMCALDPFCALSHLTAMAYHGLTDRLPTTVFISTPRPTEWRARATARMQRDLGDDLDAYRRRRLPALVPPTVERIGQRPVVRHIGSRLGGVVHDPNRPVRVTNLGRTFLDMVRRPDLCGGIRHVRSVFQEHAETYLRPLLSEIDTHGTKIDKVRAGYLLDEVCDLEHATIDGWQAFAQRGGSRKLDPQAPYDGEHFSERWALSIND